MSFALRDALFEEGRDISDPVTLEYLAHDLGVVMPDESDRAAVLADWDEGQRRGVLGSPHFFCGDTDVFCPSLDITKDPVEGLSVVRDVSRLTAFVERCLAQPGRREPSDPDTSLIPLGVYGMLGTATADGGRRWHES